MRITRRELTEMVAAEVRYRLHELASGEDADKKGGDGKKKSRKPQTADAIDSPSPRPGDGKNPKATNNAISPTGSSPDLDQEEDPDGSAVDGEQPDPDAAEQADDEEEEQNADDAIDPEGDSGEEPSGAVNDEVSGKTVQAITIEPESEVLLGSKEIVLAFNESTDVLRICVTQTGEVKFFWRGQLHDLP